jgi:hypothetical protein
VEVKAERRLKWQSRWSEGGREVELEADVEMEVAVEADRRWK